MSLWEGSKRVLFIGNTQGPSTSLYYYVNLIRAGHTVYPFDPEYFNPQNSLEEFHIRLAKSPSRKRIESVSEDLIQLCRANPFDIVFVFAENFLSAETLEEIRRTSRVSPILIYHSHDNNFAPGILKPADFKTTLVAYDYVFTTKSKNVAKYKAIGQERAFYLPSAFEPSVHCPITDDESQFTKEPFPITFIGTYDQSRAPFLDAVGWESLYVWGNGWDRFPHFKSHEKKIEPRAVYYYEYADILSHSSCVLGLLREEASDLHTQRTFEIPACGSLQIAPRNEEILSFFDENKEIVCFESLDELKDRAQFYLAHPNKRKEIARRGFERVLRDHHTYFDRVQSILETIGVGTQRVLHFVKAA